MGRGVRLNPVFHGKLEVWFLLDKAGVAIWYIQYVELWESSRAISYVDEKGYFDGVGPANLF